MKAVILASALAISFACGASAQTYDDLLKDEKTPQDVLTYGMGYSAQRFSPLKKINKNTVKRLVPAWSYSMGDNRGVEAQAVVRDGVVYITDHEKTVAVDALSGKQIWKSVIEYPPETTRVVCCGIVNRGAVLYDDKVYRTTLDAQVIALDAKTGKEVWRTKSSSPAEGYSMTVAPLVVKGIVIVGVSGSEFGIRGYLEGYDAKSGERLWRTYTIPAPGEPGSETWAGESMKTGGGSTWITGSYDPDLDTVYWGVGNPAPWNPLGRKGDNLYTNSMLALDPKSGKVKWYYQMSPNDPFDYDGVNELVLADVKVNGEPRKVIMQANRNGFLYVVDRINGKLISANKFTTVTWATHVDLQTGRPVWSDATKAIIEKGQRQRIFPSATGGKNWQPMSFSPKTGLLYVNTINVGWDYEPLPVEQVAHLKAGQPFQGVKRESAFEDPNVRGALKAIEPVTGKVRWEVPGKSPNMSGTMVTAGGLVFTGKLTGEFVAYDADNGKELWSFQTPSGIVGQPITWEMDGKQYVTVTSGIGGVYALRSGDPNLANVPPGGSLWTFRLMDK